MLTVGMSITGPQMVLQPTSPLVYLDHWGLRRFAEDPALASRLTMALHTSGGSLAFSCLNLREYARNYIEQRAQVEQLIEGIIPAIFCLEFEPFQVASRERTGEAVPHADVALATTLLRRQQATLKPYTAAGLFEGIEQLALREDMLALRVQGRLQELQQEYLMKPEFRQAVKQADTSSGTMAGTRMETITRALVGTLIEDGRTNIRTSDAIDLLHAAVPVAYCDVVLLDGGWVDRVDRARRKLNKAHPPVRLAAVFSARRGGVERFVAHLETATRSTC